MILKYKFYFIHLTKLWDAPSFHFYRESKTRGVEMQREKTFSISMVQCTYSTYGAI